MKLDNIPKLWALCRLLNVNLKDFQQPIQSGTVWLTEVSNSVPFLFLALT